MLNTLIFALSYEPTLILFSKYWDTQENGTIAKNYEIVNNNNFYVEVKKKEKNQLFLFYIIYVFPSYVSFS